VDDKEFEKVREFIYFGYSLTEDNNSTTEKRDNFVGKSSYLWPK
jgi:hypothetical protein